MRFAVPVLFLLLSACASEPEYPSPHAVSTEAYNNPVYPADIVPGTLALSAAPCISYYTPAYPPPLGLIPCQTPLMSTYAGYGYPFYPGYRYPFYSGYAYPFFPTFGYAFYGARHFPYYAAGRAGYAYRHAPGHTHSGRRGKK